MATTAVWTKIDEDQAVEALREAGTKLDAGNGDITLNFSSVRRIDASLVRAMEELAARANERSVEVTLRGANVDVYKVLKLMKLTSRFNFVV
jgi:anti-anti-sigma regulatory factor